MADLRPLLQRIDESSPPGGSGPADSTVSARLYGDTGAGWAPVASLSAFGFAYPRFQLVDGGGIELRTTGSLLHIRNALPGSDITRGRVVLTSTTETEVIAGVSGKYLHVTGVILSNRSGTAVSVDILSKPAGAGTLYWTIYVPAGQTVAVPIENNGAGLRMQSQHGVSAQLSAGVTDVVVNIVGYYDTD